jgi:hypothetical protein
MRSERERGRPAAGGKRVSQFADGAHNGNRNGWRLSQQVNGLTQANQGNSMLRTVLLVTVLLTAIPADSKSLVREFTGNKNATTAEFTVQAPWLLDWRLDGDFDSLVALDISLIEARTGRHVGRVLHTKYKGNGVKLFDEGGTYQLRISSTLARWRIKIEQITDEEAKLYTPRTAN